MAHTIHRIFYWSFVFITKGFIRFDTAIHKVIGYVQITFLETKMIIMLKNSHLLGVFLN